MADGGRCKRDDVRWKREEGDNFIPTSTISLILQQSHPNPVR